MQQSVTFIDLPNNQTHSYQQQKLLPEDSFKDFLRNNAGLSG